MRKYALNIAGSVVVMTALMMPFLVGMTGVGVDVSMWMMERRNVQTAADAAVIAAAWEIANGDAEDYVRDAALREAQNNGYEGDSLSLDIGETSEGLPSVRTTLSQPSDVYFSRIIYKGDISVAVSAAAEVLPPVGDFCMLSLDRDDSGAFVIDGNVSIDSEGCGLAVNSNHPTAALNINGGSADILVGDVSVVGGIDGEDVLDADTIQTGVAPFRDPYNNLDIPDFTGCSQAQMSAGPATSGSIPAADANGVRVLCGGLSITNQEDVTLAPGVYVLDGGDADIRGTLRGEGVTIILTNSGGSSYGSYGHLDVKGDLYLSAPESGELSGEWEAYEGVAVYQDRNAPASSQCSTNSIGGNGAAVVNGTMYLPSQCFDVGGASSSSSDGICSRIIAKVIKLHGNPAIGNDCEGSAAADIGRYSVRLTL